MSSVESTHKHSGRSTGRVGGVQEVKLHLLGGIRLGSVLEENRRLTGTIQTTTDATIITQSIPTIPTSNKLSTSPRKTIPPLLTAAPPPPPGAAVINWIANRGNIALPSTPSPRGHQQPNNNTTMMSTMTSTLESGSNIIMMVSGQQDETKEQRFARRQLVKHSRKKLPLHVSQSQLVYHAGALGGGMEEDVGKTVSGVCPPSSYMSSRSAAYSATASALAIAPLNMSKLAMSDGSFSGTATTIGTTHNNNDNSGSILGGTVSGRGRRRRSVSSSTSEDSETAFPLYGGPAQHSRPIATGKTLQKLVEPTDVRARVKHTTSSKIFEPSATNSPLHYPKQMSPASSAPPLFPSASQSFVANQLVSSDISVKFGNSCRARGSGGGSSRRTKPERLRLRNFVESKQKASCLHADGPFSNGTIQSPRITVPSTGRTFPQQHAALMLSHALNEQLLPSEAIHRMSILEEEHTAFEYIIADHLITFRALEWGRQQRYLAFHATTTIVGSNPSSTPTPQKDDITNNADNGATASDAVVLPTSERPFMSEEERSRLVTSVLNEYRAYEEQFHSSPSSTVPNSRGGGDAGGDKEGSSGATTSMVAGYSTQVMRPQTIRVLNDEQGYELGDRSEEAVRRFIVASVKRKIYEEHRRVQDACIGGGGGGTGGWKVTSGGQRHHALRDGEPLPLSATVHHQDGRNHIMHHGTSTLRPQHHLLHSQNQKELDDVVDRVELELGNFTLLGSTLTGSSQLRNNTISQAGDVGATSNTHTFARPMSPKSFVTPRPPAVEAIHTRNQHVGRQIRSERHERNQQLAAAALLDHQPHYNQESQPKTTVAPTTTATLLPNVVGCVAATPSGDMPEACDGGLEKPPHTPCDVDLPGTDDTLEHATTTPYPRGEEVLPTPPTTQSKATPRPATYVTPSPLSPRTTIQTSKSVVLRDDVIGSFLTSTPIVGMSRSMGPLVSPAVPFPRKHIPSTYYRPKGANATAATSESSRTKLTHKATTTATEGSDAPRGINKKSSDVTLSIPSLPPTTSSSTQQQEHTAGPLLPTSTLSVSPPPARCITVVTSETTSPNSTSRIASLSLSGHHGLNSSIIEDEL